MDFTIEVDMFQNGAQNMYFRTVYDGSQDVRVLCDANGKAIQAPTLGEYTNVLFTVDYYGTKIDTITDDDTYSRVGIINACGGAVNVTALDAGASVFLLVMGTHVQFCNADNLTTTPSVTEWAWLEIYADENCTELPQGNPSTVFGKLKKSLTENVLIPSETGDTLMVVVPSQPGDLYTVRWGLDWIYESDDSPNVGISRMVSGNPNPGSVEGIQTKFY